MSSADSKDNIIRFIRNVGDITLMKEMLEKREISDINIRDGASGDCTALMWQAYDGTVEGMAFLLAHKPPALPNLQNCEGVTALHWSVMNGDNPAKVRLLLDHGADKTIRNYAGHTALDIAWRRNRKECIKVLESYPPKPRG